MIENRPHILKPCIDPFAPSKRAGPTIVDWKGRAVTPSFGMCEAAYDIRLRGPITVIAGYMVPGVALEHLSVPHNMRVDIKNKSTNHRLGITVAGRAEPGWHGWLTIEVTYVPLVGAPSIIELPEEWPIAALEFEYLKQEADYGAQPNPKYQGATEVQCAR